MWDKYIQLTFSLVNYLSFEFNNLMMSSFNKWDNCGTNTWPCPSSVECRESPILSTHILEQTPSSSPSKSGPKVGQVQRTVLCSCTLDTVRFFQHAFIVSTYLLSAVTEMRHKWDKYVKSTINQYSWHFTLLPSPVTIPHSSLCQNQCISMGIFTQLEAPEPKVQQPSNLDLSAMILTLQTHQSFPRVSTTILAKVRPQKTLQTFIKPTQEVMSPCPLHRK